MRRKCIKLCKRLLKWRQCKCYRHVKTADFSANGKFEVGSSHGKHRLLVGDLHFDVRAFEFESEDFGLRRFARRQLLSSSFEQFVECPPMMLVRRDRALQ